MSLKLKTTLLLEFRDIFLWLPLFQCLGVLLYFSLSFEPHILIGLASSIFSVSILIIVRNRITLAKIWLLIVLTMIGFTASQLRTYSMSGFEAQLPTEQVWLKGVISDIQIKNKNKRIILSDPFVYKYSNINLNKIRLNTYDKQNLRIGCKIKVKVTLIKPPLPAVMNGFNFSRYAFFKGINAIGFTTSQVKVVECEENLFKQIFSKARQAITEQIFMHLSQPSSGIATGILVGDSSSISPQDYEIVRVSGIAHLLAISGMHMVVVVTIVFIIIRWLINRSEYLTLHINSKKWAALVALIISSVYLLLTLAPVSAQRAYIMSSIVLLAILLDHKSSAKRGIALSAIMILATTPEEILNPSLQMSFAASLALICSYTWFNRHLSVSKKHGLFKVLNYCLSIMFSTIVASIATAPFIIYHFHQFSSYSVVTNLLAIPINDFWVMPWGLMALILMPFRLEFIPLKMMGYGIEVIYSLASLISQLPHASFSIRQYSDMGIFLIATSGYMLMICKTRLKYAFIVVILIGLLMKDSNNKPDILIQESGKLFAIRYGDQLLFSSKKIGKFTREIWRQTYDSNEIMTLRDANLDQCNEKLCRLIINGCNVLISNSDENTDTDHVDLLINLSGNNRSAKCTIDTNDLRKLGNTAIWLSGDIKIIGTKRNDYNRPWNV